ncbi:hypothetical protein EYC80_006445 [Monilinia laxa]|uniref:Rhodopsin domain-containing protein n=1 Tax=Monilinia laxa TaxID=61186 RepID=A0A5N6JSQ8_MONLA|nr:hypothetical protein EYC80_006445 [Monilinia laxa]
MVDSSLQSFALFIVAFFPALAFFLVCLRTWSRYGSNQFGWDDGLIVVAMILSIGETWVTWRFAIKNYIGIHVWDIPVQHDKITGLKYGYAVQVLYNPILAIVKSSILIFLLRISGQKKNVKYTIWGLLAFNNIMMVAIFFGVIFQCTPIAFNWQPDIPGGYCIKQGLFYVVTAIIFLITDIMVLLIPFWIVVGLKMPRKTKLAVIGVFFLGIFVTMVGVVRLWVMICHYFLPPPEDPTYGIGFCTSSIENNLAIITASAPALKPLFRHWFPNLFSTVSNTPYHGRNGGPHDPTGTNYGHGTRKSGVWFKGSRFNGGNGVIKLDNMPDSRGVEKENSARIGVVTRNGEVDSDEEAIVLEGIMKTANISVSYGRNEDGKSEISDSQYGVRTSIESL